MDKLKEAIAAVTLNVSLAPGDMVIINNRTTMHGRKAFTAQYDGNDRHLIRSYVMGDMAYLREEQKLSSIILQKSSIL